MALMARLALLPRRLALLRRQTLRPLARTRTQPLPALEGQSPPTTTLKLLTPLLSRLEPSQATRPPAVNDDDSKLVLDDRR